MEAGATHYPPSCFNTPDCQATGISIAVVGALWPVSPLEAAAVVAHEMVHASLPGDAGHDGRFESMVRAIGLGGPATSTIPGPGFEDWFVKHVRPAIDANRESLRWEPSSW